MAIVAACICARFASSASRILKWRGIEMRRRWPGAPTLASFAAVASANFSSWTSLDSSEGITCPGGVLVLCRRCSVLREEGLTRPAEDTFLTVPEAMGDSSSSPSISLPPESRLSRLLLGLLRLLRVPSADFEAVKGWGGDARNTTRSDGD